ncbi:hypothetical protein [Niallia oryzisoli]|uniref:hypothetical protein n=1 Tax=Niallia oryzisoli TaxID=1737571 RepID=UPI003735EA03
MDVVITDKTGKIVDSAQINPFKQYLDTPSSNIPKKEQIVEENWSEGPFMVSPVQSGGQFTGLYNVPRYSICSFLDSSVE